MQQSTQQWITRQTNSMQQTYSMKTYICRKKQSPRLPCSCAGSRWLSNHFSPDLHQTLGKVAACKIETAKPSQRKPSSSKAKKTSPGDALDPMWLRGCSIMRSNLFKYRWTFYGCHTRVRKICLKTKKINDRWTFYGCHTRVRRHVDNISLTFLYNFIENASTHRPNFHDISSSNLYNIEDISTTPRRCITHLRSPDCQKLSHLLFPSSHTRNSQITPTENPEIPPGDQGNEESAHQRFRTCQQAMKASHVSAEWERRRRESSEHAGRGGQSRSHHPLSSPSQSVPSSSTAATRSG